jgi:hypothetical protein
MAEFNVRSDSVDVEQIMQQIRARIREKRGVDYTEEEIRELANVRLERFLDPSGLRSDLLEQFRRRRTETAPPPAYNFEDTTLFESHRLPLLTWVRRLLRPVLKLFFNPTPLIHALHIQADLNRRQAALEPLYFELMHNLVIEVTRLGIETKNLKMRVESIASRLDFDERRARMLEGVVQYRPGTVPPGADEPAGPPGPGSSPQETAERRRRRRRGRRRPGSGAPKGGEPGEASTAGSATDRDEAGGPAGEAGPGADTEPSDQ